MNFERGVQNCAVTHANTSTEAGFSPLIQVFLSRFYAREKLGTRVAVWLAMAPLG